MKYFLIGIVFAGIIGSMVAAGFHLINRGDARSGAASDDESGRRLMLSLALRAGLSVLLFVGILVAWKLGLIQPVGIPTQS